MASFLFLYSSCLFAFAQSSQLDDLVGRALQHKLYDNPEWHALLELKQGQPINPTHYYLSNSANPKEELVKTLELIAENPAQACNIPARKRFIEHALGLPQGQLTWQPCPEYQRFTQQVPNQDIYLVFASENVTSASSMMGHIMLRLDGVNEDGLAVKHGATFFTELDTFNIPKLLYETLLVGKQGLFHVSPYAPFQHHYREVEQRNIWEFKLKLSNYHKALIQDRIWELGAHSPAYFFDKYNCSTLTQLLLTLAAPTSINNLDRIITPLDVVKYAHHHEIVEQTQLVPSNKWKVNGLAKAISRQQRQATIDSLQAGTIALRTDPMSESEFIHHEYQKSLNGLLRSGNQISKQTFDENKHALTENQKWAGSLLLDVSGSEHPILRTAESQLQVGVTQFDHQEFVTLRYFPVANTLQNDNRGVIGETQLLLSDVALRVSTENASAYIDRFMLYNMVSRIPYNLETRSVSTSFKFGLERVLDEGHSQQLVLLSELALGYTAALNGSLGVYAEAAVGAGADFDTQYVFAEPRVGMYGYLSQALKANVELSRTFNQYASSRALDTLRTELTYYLAPDSQLQLSFDHANNSRHHFNQISAAVSIIF